MIIYKVTNKINGKEYIGGTTMYLEQRMWLHHSDARLEKTNMRFHKALREFGEESFEWSIIKECVAYRDLVDSEPYYINKYNTIDNGYNEVSRGVKNPKHASHLKEA